MNKIAFVTISLVLCGILGYLTIRHLHRLPRVAGTYVSRIDKQTISYPKNADFKYYYVENPSATISEKRPWDNTYATYTINNDSLNERFDYDIARDEELLRIVTLGDSFTFGHFVDTKDNWTEVLEDTLTKKLACKNISKIEVINLGERGFDIPYTTKKYNDVGLQYKPDLIIWFESGTGFTRYNELMRPYIEECETKESSTSATYVEDIARCWVQSEKMMLRKYSEKTIRSLLNGWMDRFLSLRAQTPVLFATLRSLPNGDKNILREKQEKNTNVFFTDEIPDIYSQAGVFSDGHPNPKGHQIIADSLYTYLDANKKSLLHCN